MKLSRVAETIVCRFLRNLRAIEQERALIYTEVISSLNGCQLTASVFRKSTIKRKESVTHTFEEL